MKALELTQRLVRSCLQLGDSVRLQKETALLGGFPEFNSLTITALIVEIEEVLDCEVSDEEITADIFETVGSLSEFIGMKMEQA